MTALYEIVPAEGARRFAEPLRYGQEAAGPRGARDGEVAFLKIRYKLPGEASTLIEAPVTDRDAKASVDAASGDTASRWRWPPSARCCATTRGSTALA